MGLLQASGVSPDAPAPSYQLPTVPKDLATARKAAYQIEEDCAKAWRAVVGMTDISALRGIAQQAMSDSAVWTTRIKMAAKDPKPTVTLPGTT